MKKKILVRGPALSQTGYGEQCRFALRSLRSKSHLFDVYVHPTAWGNSSWLMPNDPDREWIDTLIRKTVEYHGNGGTFDISLQVTIPNEWERLCPINIGYTAGIETTRIAPEWIEKSALMDKIITISNHSKNVFANTVYTAVNNETKQEFPVKCTTPIDVVHYPVRNYDAAPLGIDLDYDFNYLLVAQWGPRKNIENTIGWWLEEFRDEEVGLVVKTNLLKTSVIDREFTLERLRNIVGSNEDRKCKVYLVHGYMTPEEMTGLYQHDKIKCLVSLTHGEGFGLPLFEAASNGVPIIAPNWSGHVDFLYAPKKKTKKGKTKFENTACFAKVDYDLRQIQPEVVWDGVLHRESSWCYPKEDSYRKQLRNMRDNYNRFVNLAKILQAHVQREFTTDKQYGAFADAVFEDELSKISVDDIPKISVITSVYNGDEYIEQFMEDITRQTIFDKCELIMINANSPGNEEAVIKRYMKKHKNIIYKKYKTDPGIYGTWNRAIKLATGEYVTNANLDDRKAPNSLEMHARNLVNSPDVGLVYADSLITENPNETFESNTSAGRQYNFEDFSREAMLRGNQPHNNPMWRRSLHEKHGLFDKKYKSAGDWEFFLRLAFGGEKFKKIGGPLGLYYFNPTGISTAEENKSWKQEEEKEIFKKYFAVLREEQQASSNSLVRVL
jgi:glycosyltransferase involved in cell wall biosynthesis